MALVRSHVSQETPTAAALVSVLKWSTRFSSARHCVALAVSQRCDESTVGGWSRVSACGLCRTNVQQQVNVDQTPIARGPAQ